MDNKEILDKLEEIRSATLIGCKDALTTKDATIITGLSIQYIYKLVQDRQIPHYRSKGGKIIYFKKSELNEWMLSTRVRTKKEIDAEATKRVSLH
ncbi:helix-turn-helix transcriptional regulator [Phocaeicola sp.]